MRLPSGYESISAGATVLVTRSSWRDLTVEAVREAGSLHAWAASHSNRSFAGRATAHVVDAPGGAWVVRHYVRGGAVADVLGDRYLRLGPPRPLRELWVSVWARSRGIPTPEVMAVGMRKSGIIYRADIATLCIPDSATLADITFGDTRESATTRIAAWQAAGTLVRDAADAGVLHADLNLRNVLIARRASGPRPYLLDLDRCRIVGRASRSELMRMVARLHRSASRFSESSGTDVSAELHAFDAGVHG
jgi:3-deoxy-D-manno-octulosonic acid kinase